MHMFFAAVSKRGRRLEEAERRRITECIRAHVMFRGMCRLVDATPTPSSFVVGVSNEPTGGWRETPERQTFVSGYCSAPGSLARAPLDLDLARRLGQVCGRFSTLIIDRKRGVFGVATPAARVDSIFRAENEDFAYFGNQASLLSVLRDGALRFAPRRLMTLLDASFFGNDATPYEGVDAVPSNTTLLVEGSEVRQRTNELWTLKPRLPSSASLGESLLSRLAPGREFSAFDANVRRLSEHLARAFEPLLTESRVTLALTGGMDSRLLLSAALAAGVRVDCFTNRVGDTNSADVWLAQHVARLLGVKHEVRERAHPSRHGRQEKQLDLLKITKRTLARSDGMLGFRYPLPPMKPFTPTPNVSGQGGEILRGGYGEKEWKPAALVLGKRWNHFPKLYRPEVVGAHRDELKARLERYPESLPNLDLLDCIYVDLRCGRWAAASTSASTTSIRPLLDNVVVSEALAIPARVKRLHVVHRRLIEVLCPKLRDVPLANKHWHGTGPLRRRLIASRWQQAFAHSPRPLFARNERSLQETSEATIKRYLLEEDRLSLLKDLVRVDEVRRYLGKPPSNTQLYHRLLTGLYTVSVLLCEDWRR